MPRVEVGCRPRVTSTAARGWPASAHSPIGDPDIDGDYQDDQSEEPFDDEDDEDDVEPLQVAPQFGRQPVSGRKSDLLLLSMACCAYQE